MTTQILLRPSAASRWIQCPASTRLCATVPESVSGQAAQLGTAIHALAHQCWLFDSNPMHTVGDTVEGIVITTEAAAFAAQHIATVKELESRAGVMLEHHVTAFQSPAIKVAGTADVIGWDSETDTLDVMDLKTGRGYVDADSDQMKIYALGAMRELKRAYGVIKLTIVQPQTGANRTHTMTLQELSDWDTKVLVPAVQAALDPNTKPQPSETACQWCPARAVCPAHIETFEAIDTKVLPAALSESRLAELLGLVESVEDYIVALRAYATQQIKDGAVIRGWQMGPKRPTRKWLFPLDGTIEALLDLGLSASEIYPHELITPAAAEKLLGKRKGLLEPLTKKESSGLTLCRAAGIGE